MEIHFFGWRYKILTLSLKLTLAKVRVAVKINCKADVHLGNSSLALKGLAEIHFLGGDTKFEVRE